MCGRAGLVWVCRSLNLWLIVISTTLHSESKSLPQNSMWRCQIACRAELSGLQLGRPMVISHTLCPVSGNPLGYNFFQKCHAWILLDYHDTVSPFWASLDIVRSYLGTVGSTAAVPQAHRWSEEFTIRVNKKLMPWSRQEAHARKQLGPPP